MPGGASKAQNIHGRRKPNSNFSASVYVHPFQQTPRLIGLMSLCFMCTDDNASFCTPRHTGMPYICYPVYKRLSKRTSSTLSASLTEEERICKKKQSTIQFPYGLHRPKVAQKLLRVITPQCPAYPPPSEAAVVWLSFVAALMLGGGEVSYHGLFGPLQNSPLQQPRVSRLKIDRYSGS